VKVKCSIFYRFDSARPLTFAANRPFLDNKNRHSFAIPSLQYDRIVVLLPVLDAALPNVGLIGSIGNWNAKSAAGGLQDLIVRVEMLIFALGWRRWR